MGERRKRKNGFLRVLGMALLLAAAVAAVALAVRSQREGGLRSFWRSLRGKNGAEEFFFENASGGDVAALDLGLAVASNSGLYVYDSEGELTYSRLYTWQSPAVKTEGDYGAAWDVGGKLALFFDDDKVIKEIATEDPVVAVGVNQQGYAAVCTEQDNRGIVTVYNSLGTAIYRWSAGNDRVLTACVSGRDELMVVTVGRGGSRVLLMRLDSEELGAEYTYPGLILDAAFTDAGVAAITTQHLIGLSSALEERWRADFEGRYLENYSLSPSGCLLSLSDFQVGGGRTLSFITAEGENAGSLELDAQAADLDVMDDRRAVLSDGVLTVYGPNLQERERYACDFGAERVILRTDGTVLAAGTFSAYVYGKDEA